MTRIDKLLYEAKILDVRTREYKPCLIIEKIAADRWTVRGYTGAFSSEAQAVEFCKEQAAGRPLGIVIDDIPHILPESDYVNTRTIPDDEAIKELINNADEGSSKFVG